MTLAMGLWGALGQGGGVGVQAVLEKGITVVHRCQGPQGLVFCKCFLPFLTVLSAVGPAGVQLWVCS